MPIILCANYNIFNIFYLLSTYFVFAKKIFIITFLIYTEFTVQKKYMEKNKIQLLRQGEKIWILTGSKSSIFLKYGFGFAVASSFFNIIFPNKFTKNNHEYLFVFLLKLWIKFLPCHIVTLFFRTKLFCCQNP